MASSACASSNAGGRESRAELRGEARIGVRPPCRAAPWKGGAFDRHHQQVLSLPGGEIWSASGAAFEMKVQWVVLNVAGR